MTRTAIIGPCTPKEKAQVRQRLIESGEPVEGFVTWESPELRIIFFSPTFKRWISTTDRECNISAGEFLKQIEEC